MKEKIQKQRSSESSINEETAGLRSEESARKEMEEQKDEKRHERMRIVKSRIHKPEGPEGGYDGL
jgi:hypothetical protein